MDLVDLQVFKCVVDEGGIIKAARELHRVPSSVTTRVKQLETSLGVTLFHRDRQRFRKSQEGGGRVTDRQSTTDPKRFGCE